jgi:hypothetical protein
MKHINVDFILLPAEGSTLARCRRSLERFDREMQVSNAIFSGDDSVLG